MHGSNFHSISVCVKKIIKKVLLISTRVIYKT